MSEENGGLRARVHSVNNIVYECRGVTRVAFA